MGQELEFDKAIHSHNSLGMHLTVKKVEANIKPGFSST